MGKKQKAKAAKAASQLEQQGKEQSGSEKSAESEEKDYIFAELPPIPSCQALVDKYCQVKCGEVSISLDGKWCEYHTKMRADLYQSFHELLQLYHSTSDSMLDMALIQEAADLDWVEGHRESLNARIESLNKALLCRTCFMDRLHGDDLDFKPKKYIKGLRDARIRLQSNLKVMEERMFILIGSASEYQHSIFIMSQSFPCDDRQQERCVHHDMHPDNNRTFMFPIDRRYHHQLRINSQESVVDGYIAEELRRFRVEILEKLGVQIIRPTNDQDSNHHKLIVHWDTHDEQIRAHIAAAYFRRLCFLESHLFVQVHRHMQDLESGTVPWITIENRQGRQLDFDKDMDPSLLCMITFLLNPRLKLSHLGILRDNLWYPSSSEFFAAVRDISSDGYAYPNGKPTVEPWWSKPPKPASLTACSGHNTPDGALPLLCGMLYEVSYLKAHQSKVLVTEYCPQFGSLIRCGKCLLSMVWSPEEWIALVRAFAIRRVPLYSRILPQIIGDGVGSLWASDLATDVIRGQSRRNIGLASHEKGGQVRGNGQVPTSPDSTVDYGLDETLEIAGVVMLGVVTGGPVVRPDVTDNQRRRLLESYKLYPQIWFLLTSDRTSMSKDFTINFVRRLFLRARSRGSDLMIRGVATEFPELDEDLLDPLPFYNASQRRPGGGARWAPLSAGFALLEKLAGLKYESTPRNLIGDCPMIHLACKPTKSNGVRWLLDVVLEAAIEATSVRTKAELEETWIKSELGRTGCEPDLGGPLSYRFGPWSEQSMKEKDATIQTSSSRLDLELEHEDWPSNTPISGLQEVHATIIDPNRLQETPPHSCRSHACEATGHYSPSQETLMANCSMPVGLPQTSNPQGRPHNPSSFSGAGGSTSQSSSPESLEDHDDHPHSRRVIFSEDATPNENPDRVTHIDWFDLVMSEEGSQLPDLSDWKDARTGQNLV